MDETKNTLTVSENEANKLTTKFGATCMEVTKRAALSDIQNRGISGKDAAQKDTTHTKLQNARRNTKARVDTQWKEDEVSAVAAAKPTANVTVSKLLADFNKLGLDCTSTTGVASQGHESSNLLLEQNKTKTLATKIVENKTKTTQAVMIANSALSNQLKPKTATASGIIRGKSIKKPSTNNIKIVSVQTHSSQFLNAIEDIDADDNADLSSVTEYVNDIYNYLYTLEVEQGIKPNHLDGQEEVTPHMRAMLIDWIIAVHSEFKMAPETFQLAVAIIDSYLQAVKNTKRSFLQLVGVTALFIASKYEELSAPAIDYLAYITDNTFTGRQICQMELTVFKALDYNLTRSLPIHFLRRYIKAAYVKDHHHVMSKYFLELASLQYELAAYKPSEMAAASLFLALHLLNDDAELPTGFNNKHWTATLEHYSRYTPGYLRPIAKKIGIVARNARSAKLNAVFKKYESIKLEKISLRPELYGSLMDSIINSKD